MRLKFRRLVSGVTVLYVGMGLIAEMSANGQTTTATATSAKTKEKAGSNPWVPTRTPDGQPDLQGFYVRNGVLGVEAQPPKENRTDPSTKNPLSLSGSYPKIFNETGIPGVQQRPQQKRPMGIVDPPDRNLPWRPEEDAKRRQFLLSMNPPASLRYIEMNARCALPGVLFPLQGFSYNLFQFLQPPGSVVLLTEYNHSARIIHLDGRPHLGKDIRLFMGDSVGHWVGNSLIVDTTNFNGRIAFSRDIPYLSEALHTIERFTIEDTNTIGYEITVDDPTLFTRPWKVAGYFSRLPPGTEMMESACAEGSQTLVNIFGIPPGH